MGDSRTVFYAVEETVRYGGRVWEIWSSLDHFGLVLQNILRTINGRKYLESPAIYS